MFNPKLFVAHVFICFTIVAHAQNSKSFKTISLTDVNFKPQEISVAVSKQKPCLINFEQHQTSIPKYFQFTCNGNDASLTIQITITDGSQVQTITKDVKIDTNSLYEARILPRNRNDIQLNSNSYIKSVLIVNNMDGEVNIGSCNFSNVSMINEVNINQIFTVDLDAENQKRYMVYSKETKAISMNVYKLNGELDERVMYTLNPGENYIDFSLMKKNYGRKVLQISDDLLKKPSSKIVVMF